jgi:hypothetical protein
MADDRLLDDATVHRLMTACTAAEHGWRFLKKPIVCDDAPGGLHVPSTPDMMVRAWNNARRAAPRYNGGLWMEMEDWDGLKLAWGFEPRAPRRLLLTVDTALLRRRDQAPNARAFSAAIALLYTQLRPLYGYGLFNYDLHTPQPPDATLRAVWDYNVLGPALVEAIGRERLAYLPAWDTVAFDDGGLFLEMAANPVAEAPQYAQYYRHAAQTLGLPFYQGGG